MAKKKLILKSCGFCHICGKEHMSNEGSEGLKALVQQLITWKPETRNATDCVMALWFAVIKVRELMQKGSKLTQYTNNRWATRQQRQQRYSINLDDAIAEQWQETYG